jgi:hypothetical protein
MAVRGSTLGRKQEDAIAALLTQRNVEEAARAAGIGVRTLLRWLKLPEFQSAYRQARRDAFGQAIARLQQGTSAAATWALLVSSAICVFMCFPLAVATAIIPPSCRRVVKLSPFVLMFPSTVNHSATPGLLQ